jgi:hypothetical protein
MLFAKHEAEAKLNKTVRARMALVGIPIGTTGKVVRIDESPEGCAVIIEWDLPPSPQHKGWFSKDMYSLYIAEEP